MIEMIDKETARLRSDQGHALGRWIGKLADAIGRPFRVLHRIQYGQPWNGMAECCENLRDAGPGAYR